MLTTENYEMPEKIAARAENVRLFRCLSGLASIPVGKQYWCYSALQTDGPDSEINQMLSMGVIQTKAQFYGVVGPYHDTVAANRAAHPEAHFFGESWTSAILENDFSPALVYLDTKYVAGRKALNETASTMRLCPENTVLLVNVCQSSPWHETMDSATFLQALADRVPNLDAWIPEGGVPSFDYVSNSTLMRTFAFHLREQQC